MCFLICFSQICFSKLKLINSDQFSITEMAATQPVRRFPWGQFGRRMLCTFFGGATVGLSYTMYNMIGEMNELYPALHVRTALLVRAREELINSRSEQEKILLGLNKKKKNQPSLIIYHYLFEILILNRLYFFLKIHYFVILSFFYLFISFCLF